MSLYDNLNNEKESNSLLEQTNKIRNYESAPTVTDYIASKATNKFEENQKLVKQYDPYSNFNGKETAMIAAAIRTSNNPQESASKMIQAIEYSHYQGISFDEAYNNLDALNEYQLNKKADYTLSTCESLHNSFRIGTLAGDLNNLYEQYKNLDLSGKDTSGIVNQINAIEQEMYDLRDDSPRWITTQAAKFVGENWRYMAKVSASALGVGLATALAATGVGAVAGVPMLTAGIGELSSLTFAAYSAASGVGSIKGASDWYENEKYYRLRQQGISQSTSIWAGRLGGIVQGAVESWLGSLSKNLALAGASTLGLNLGDDAIRTLSRSAASRFNFGANGEALMYSGLKYLMNGIENGAEEVIQSAADNLTSAIVYELEGVKLSDREYETLHDMMEEGYAGLLMGMFLDVPSLPVDFIKYKNNVDADASLGQTLKYAKYLKEESKLVDSKEMFVKKHSEDTMLNPDIEAKDKEKYLGDIWEKSHDETNTSEMTEAEAKTIYTDTDINDDFTGYDEEGNEVEAKPSETLPEPKRLEDGRLRTQESRVVTENQDGTESHTLKLGSVDSSNSYGELKYTIDAENQTITIDNIATRKGHENLAKDAILELGRRNEGWNIEWNPETNAQLNLKQSMLNDSLNPNKGKLNWFNSEKDVSTSIMVANEIRKSFPNVTQQQSIVFSKMLEIKAEAEGKDLRTWLNDHVSGMKSVEMKERGAIDLDTKAAKGFIYAAKNSSDFSTLEHEFQHLWAVTDKKASEKLAKVMHSVADDKRFQEYVANHKDVVKMEVDDVIDTMRKMGEDASKWTRDEAEVVATLYELYKQNGKTFNEKLKNIFEQIAEWFHRIYQALKREGMLNEELIKAYDAYFDKDAEFRKTAEKAEQKEAKLNQKETSTSENILTGNPDIAQKNTFTESNDRNSKIAKYTNTQRYLTSNIEGNVYIDTERKALSNKNESEKQQYDKELKMAHKLADKYDCKVFMLPPSEENGAIYVEKNSNPDSVVEGMFVDFKKIESNKTNAVQRALKEGIRQADAVYIEIGNNLTLDRAENALKGQIKSNSHNHEGFEIVLSDSLGNFRSYQINQKGLARSPFIGGAKLAPLSSYKYNKDLNNVNMLYQSAYHGSGAEFDQFLEDKIGSANNGATYGYGFYVTDSDLIGKEYARAGQFSQESRDGMIQQWVERRDSALNKIKEYEKEMEQYDIGENDYIILDDTIHRLSLNVRQYNSWINKFNSKPIQRRNLYKLTIPDNTGENYLNWDKKATKSTKRKIYNSLYEELSKGEGTVAKQEMKKELTDLENLNDTNGEQIYNNLIAYLGSDKEASQFLSDLGYTGIIYKAGQIMGLPDSVSDATNYVIFNSNDIQIDNHWTYDTDEEATRFYQLDITKSLDEAEITNNENIANFTKTNGSKVVTVDGIKYLKDDPGFDYSEENIRNLKNEVSERIRKIKDDSLAGQLYFDFGSTANDNTGSANLRKGLSEYFSFEKGWNGKELAIPSVENQWDKFGYIDFTNTVIKDEIELAQLWSIYRNPQLEYFHLVFTKDNKIVDSLALSSGISSSSIAVLGTWDKNPGIIAERMKNSGADGYYMLHNHPSGKIEASEDDISVTRSYITEVPGFKGHIILDHNKYTLINKNLQTFENQATGFHEIAVPDIKFDADYATPSIAYKYSRAFGNNSGIVFTRWANGGVRATSVVPLHNVNYLDLESMLDLAESSFASRAFILVNSEEEFNRVYDDLAGTQHLFTDLILLSDKGFIITSAAETYSKKGYYDKYGDADKIIVARKRYRGELINPKFQTGDKTLFQLENDIEQTYINDAKDFESKQEFIAFEQSMAFGDDTLTDEKLSEIWDKAHNLYEVKNGSTESPITENMTDDEKGTVFRDIMSTDEGIKAFVDRMREAFNYRNEVRKSNGSINASTEEDYQDIIQKISNADRIEREASQFIVRTAMGNKDLTDTDIKKIRSTIENATREYRELYAQVIGDENFSVGVYNEYMPDINESRGTKITERKNLIERLQGEEIRESVRKGTEKYDGTAEKVMAVYDKEIADLTAKHEKLKAEYDKNYLKLSVAQQDAVNKSEQISKMESAINRETQNVRNKLDAGMRVSSEEMKRLNTWQDKLNLLHEEIKELRKQDAVKAAIKKKEELNKLKQELRQKELDKAAVKKVHDYKRGLLNDIIAKIPNNVDYAYAEKINALVSSIKGISGYQNKTITIDGVKMSLDDFRKAVDEGKIKYEGLTPYELKRYHDTSLADMTIVDLETLRDTVEYYKKMGKQMWQAKVDQRAYQTLQRQNKFINDLMLNPRYDRNKNLPGSVESQKDKKTVRDFLNLCFTKSLNMSRKFQMLSNHTEGAIWQFAVQQKRDLQSQELAAIDKRISPIEELRKQLGVNWNDFYETVNMDLSALGHEMMQTYTISDLIYGLMAQKEERNRLAFAYGDLVSADEKASLNHDNNLIKKLGNRRNNMFVEQATAYMADRPNLMKIAEAIDADFQNQSQRLFDLSVREYNKPMEIVSHYLPILRLDSNGTELSNKIQDDIYNRNAGKGKTLPNKGMFESRIDINADHQMPTMLDFINTWYQTVNEQEHLIHTLAFVRDLNATFKNYGSRDLRTAIENTYGQSMMQDIDNYINEIANPNLFTDTQGINSIIKVLRGGMYTGYLGFKASSIVVQGITSPAAFLQEVSPIQLAKGLLKMTAQPQKTWAMICQLSPMMEHRSMNPVIDEISKEAQKLGDNKVKKLYNSFLDIGTTGLEMIDRWAVAGGWLACFDKKLSEFENQADANAIKEAVKYADKVVINSQPVSDVTEIAPLFKSKNEFAKAFTQFQVSLNVIWNNVLYDNGIKAVANLKNKKLDSSVKKQIFGKVVGCLAGYAFAGALLTMVQGGDDDDDKEKNLVKDLVYGATTQFTSAVPLLANLVDYVTKAKITGEKGFKFETSLYPALSPIAEGAASLVSLDKKDKNYEKKFRRALYNLTEGAALMTGAPVSGVKELGYLFTEDGLKQSVVNGKFEFTVNPGALLGRRKK